MRRNKRQIEIRTAAEIELMAESCLLAAATLAMCGREVKPGISTERLDQLARTFIADHGAIAAPLNYHGFPKSICTSPNEVVCHGIPSRKVILRDGDIVNIDVTTILHGFHGDCNRTFGVGRISKRSQSLIDMARSCLWRGINEIRATARLGNIGAAIQRHAEAHGYGVVRDYCGHGIGRVFHAAPEVRHYGKPGTGMRMRKGMTFTVEPMINAGDWRCHPPEADNWTVRTVDGAWSAQFEHTCLVTMDGVEVLTDPVLLLKSEKFKQYAWYPELTGEDTARTERTEL